MADHRLNSALLSALLFSGVLMGCDRDPDPTAPSAPTVESISVKPETAELDHIGQPIQFTATVRDQSDNEMADVEVTWSSSDPSVLDIEADGTATAVAKGSATVQAKADSVSGEAQVSVEQVIATLLLSDATVAFRSLGDTTRVHAEALDAGGTEVADAVIQWSSADTTVVTVSGDGLFIAHGTGSTLVSAVADTFQVPVQVSVEQVPSGMEVTAGRDTLSFLGDTVTLQVESWDSLGNPVPVSTLDVSWTSANPEIATVDGSGKTTAVANGSTMVECRTGDLTGSATIVVRQVGNTLSVWTQPGEAAAGIAFGVQPVVEVLDAGGSLVTIDSVTVVTAAMISGQGELTGTSTVAAEAGRAVFDDLAIAGTAGERQLGFSAGDLGTVESSTFQLDPGQPTTIAAESGTGQQGPIHTELPDPLVVLVSDDWGNGVGGVSIQWTVVAGEGSLAVDSNETGADGRNAARYTLGGHAGQEVVEAQADLEGSPVQFHLTALANATIEGVVTLGTAAPLVPGMSAGAASTPASRAGTGSDDFRAMNVTYSSRRPALTDHLPQSQAVLPHAQPAPEYVDGELIVTYRPEAVGVPGRGVLSTMSTTQATALGDRIRSELLALDGRLARERRPARFTVVGVSPVTLGARLRLEDPARTGEVMLRLQAEAGILAVERNMLIRRPMAPPTPLQPALEDTLRQRNRPISGMTAPRPSPAEPTVDDPFYVWQAWHYRMLDLPEAWRITTGDPSVIVAVIDDGIRFDHPDIAGNLTQDGYDFVSNDFSYDYCDGGTIGRSGDGDGYDPDPTVPLDVVWNSTDNCISGVSTAGGHGLHVAGTIGATTNDGIGGAGTNWNVSIRPVRVLDIKGTGTSYDIAQGILYAAGLAADDGAGGSVQAAQAAHVLNLSLGAPGSSEHMKQAVEQAAQADALIIAAAGNDASSDPMYPAAYPEVVSVSAVAPTGELASYSNHGSTIELAAPGGEMAWGCDSGIISTVWNFETQQPGWMCYQGTSMAAPHVAGAAALIYAAEPGIPAEQVRSRLRDWAVDAGEPGWNQQFGHGIVNARNTLTSSLEISGDIHVRLVDAATGTVVEQTRAAANGYFQFSDIPAGDYILNAGQDTEGDGISGVPGRRWGAPGSAGRPDIIVVTGTETHTVDFSIGIPVQEGPNNTIETANELSADGYVQGTSSAGDFSSSDIFRIQIPEAGAYVFETSGVQGMCGFALEEDTHLQLHDENGDLILANTDMDPTRHLYCSRIPTQLEPGVYYLVVFGRYGNLRYNLHAGREP